MQKEKKLIESNRVIKSNISQILKKVSAPRVTLESITDKIGSGATPRGGHLSYHDKGIFLLRSQNIYDSEFKKEGLVFINDEQAQKLNNVTVEKGDILFNITGASVARCCLVPDEYLLLESTNMFQ